MGLLNLFKSKTSMVRASSENNLETILRKAATNPAYRPEFYKHLLSEKLIVLTAKQEFPAGVQTLQENTQVNIVALSDGKIPVFTSTSKIFDKGIIQHEVSHLEMKGEDLFNFTKGAAIVLNPYSDYGKELLPEEITSMLNGTILTDNHREMQIEKDTQVLIGQPAVYPAEIVNALKILFKSKPAVKAAYLGWIHNPASSELPHLIFALDIEGEKKDITNEAGFTAQQLSKPEDVIDFIQIDDKDGISDYFLKQTKPFYVR